MYIQHLLPNIINECGIDVCISELVTGDTELLNKSILLDITNHVELQLPWR